MDTNDPYRQALEALEARQFEQCESLLRELLRLQPRHAEALMTMGTLLLSQGQAEAAAQCLRRAVDVQPQSPRARHNLGVALGVAGHPAEARVELEQALHLQPDYPEAHYNLGNILDRLGLIHEAIRSFRRALELRPDYFEALTNLGLALGRTDGMPEGLLLLRQAARLRPQSDEAFNNLGLALHQAGQRGEASVLLRHAARLNPANSHALSNLGKVAFELGRFDEAEDYLEQALRLQPQNVEIHSNLGSVWQAQGRWEEALASFDLALSIDPQCVSAHYNRAVTLLHAGDWLRAWPEFEYRFRLKPQAPRQYPAPRWDGGSLAGRTILVWAEQGLGDMIHFLRYASLLEERGATVILECSRRLKPLFGACVDPDRIVCEGDPRPVFDVHAPLGSLPGLVGTTPQTIPAETPYLHADPARVAYWRERLGVSTNLRVGIAWQGNPKHTDDRRRSTPLVEFAPLAGVPGVELISLQQGYGSEQFDALQGQFPVRRIVDGELDPPDTAMLETAALVKCLDLVVTVDTSLGHLCGALHVPVWLALSALPDWRWRRRGDRSPWYPSMRLFRQPKLGHWDDVFLQIARELRSLRLSILPEAPGKLSQP